MDPYTIPADFFGSPTPDKPPCVETSVQIETDDAEGWTVEKELYCDNCGCIQISVHPNCSELECRICGNMILLLPADDGT